MLIFSVDQNSGKFLEKNLSQPLGQCISNTVTKVRIELMVRGVIPTNRFDLDRRNETSHLSSVSEEFREYLSFATAHAQSRVGPANAKVFLFTMFQSVQIQTSSQSKSEHRKNFLPHVCLLSRRNTFESIRVKNRLLVQIVTNAFLTRVLIRHT